MINCIIALLLWLIISCCWGLLAVWHCLTEPSARPYRCGQSLATGGPVIIVDFAIFDDKISYWADWDGSVPAGSTLLPIIEPNRWWSGCDRFFSGLNPRLLMTPVLGRVVSLSCFYFGPSFRTHLWVISKQKPITFHSASSHHPHRVFFEAAAPDCLGHVWQHAVQLFQAGGT